MPAPRVFVSSTCYDLKYIRENLKYFIRTLGFEPVLSEEGAVYYDPNLSTVDSCLAEVPACQIFVLMIGGRSGSEYENSGNSITNVEYKQAVQAKIPIFAVVERPVLEQFRVHQQNKGNEAVDEAAIQYPAVDNLQIFEFIEEVQRQTTNNALVPFADFEELQTYLKQQWAGMMYRFLSTDSEAKRVGDILKSISYTNEKIEFITRQLINNVGNKDTKLTVTLYDIVMNSPIVRTLSIWKVKLSPAQVLKYESVQDYCDNSKSVICLNSISADEDEEGWTLSHGSPPYRASRSAVKDLEKEYLILRSILLKTIDKEGVSLKEFLEANNSTQIDSLTSVSDSS